MTNVVIFLEPSRPLTLASLFFKGLKGQSQVTIVVAVTVQSTTAEPLVMVLKGKAIFFYQL